MDRSIGEDRPIGGPLIPRDTHIQHLVRDASAHAILSYGMYANRCSWRLARHLLGPGDWSFLDGCLDLPLVLWQHAGLLKSVKEIPHPHPHTHMSDNHKPTSYPDRKKQIDAPTTNCSKDSSKSSLFTPTPPGCSTGDNGFLTTIVISQSGSLMGLLCYTHRTRRKDWCKSAAMPPACYGSCNRWSWQIWCSSASRKSAVCTD